jgi:hypothetical protein
MFKIGLILGLTAIFLAAVRAESQEADDPDQYVVQVLDQDQKLIGTGTVVSLSGLALTAKHILRDTTETGASNFYATVLVRFKNSAVFDPADVVTIHPFLDIAVLQIRGRSRPAMKVRLKTDGLSKGQDVTLIGHVLANGMLNDERSAKIDQLARHGHIVVSRGVREGTSGGPAIVDGRLIGIIRNTREDDRSTVVPIGLAVDYLRLMGIVFSEDGFARKADDITLLASRVTDYERILSDIQQDVSWKASVSRRPVQRGGQANLELAISFERKLEAQPLFDGKVTIGAVPIFAGDFSTLDSEKRLGFTYSDWLESGLVRFTNLGHDIGVIVGEYKKAPLPKLKLDDLYGFDIKAIISSIVGDSYIRQPRPLYICFSIRTKRPEDLMAASGVRCKEELNYVDRFLPIAY